MRHIKFPCEGLQLIKTMQGPTVDKWSGRGSSRGGRIWLIGSKHFWDLGQHWPAVWVDIAWSPSGPRNVGSLLAGLGWCRRQPRLDIKLISGPVASTAGHSRAVSVSSPRVMLSVLSAPTGPAPAGAARLAWRLSQGRAVCPLLSAPASSSGALSWYQNILIVQLYQCSQHSQSDNHRDLTDQRQTHNQAGQDRDGQHADCRHAPYGESSRSIKIKWGLISTSNYQR